MRQKIELVGGHMDGMVTVVEMGQQEVKLIVRADETLHLGDSLYPEAIPTRTVTYRRRLKDPRKFDVVKP